MRQPSRGFVHYQHHSLFPGIRLAPAFLRSLIEQHQPKVVFEIGSGANPTLPIAEVEAKRLRYITSDLSAEELRKAPSGYEMRQLDLESPCISEDLLESSDLVFSRMVNEHIRDGRQYHQNVFRMLRPGGIAAHCCATLYALPFTANYILPEFLSDLLLKAVSPRLDYRQNGKFRAYYSWSRGPTNKMIARFESLGFEILSFNAYFGHGYYKFRLPWLDRLEEAKTRLLLRYPNPNLCSFATIILRRPLEKETGVGAVQGNL